jgi:hypothetical protein
VILKALSLFMQAALASMLVSCFAENLTEAGAPEVIPLAPELRELEGIVAGRWCAEGLATPASCFNPASLSVTGFYGV